MTQRLGNKALMSLVDLNYGVSAEGGGLQGRGVAWVHSEHLK